jgi:hypothetical protein
MSQVEIKIFEENQMDELLALLTKWSPDHPELGEGDIVKWQKCHRFVAMHEGRIVGYIGQIAHDFKYGKKSGREGVEHIGWGVTLVLNMSDSQIRKQSGRELLGRCETNPPLQYAAVGVVPAIEEPYKRRGHVVRRDCSKMYARFLNPAKALKYLDKSSIYAPIMKLANVFCPKQKNVEKTKIEKIKEFKPEWDEKWDELLSNQHELYGIRDAEFLNYKLTQPNRDYHVYIHADDGYIIFRHATHRTKDLNLIKVCDLVGTEGAKVDLVSLAVDFAYEVKAYGIVALGSFDEEKSYKKAGMCISKPYPITMRPHITARMHISFFESDLDNLW